MDPVLINNQCQLLSGLQTYLVQALLGVVALGSLWYKRQVERPRRSFEIWGLDVGKQVIGAMTGHCLNILIAVVLPPVTDECAWYFINFLADATFGTVLSLVLFFFIKYYAHELDWSSLKESGNYGDPSNYRIWSIQLIEWISIIIMSKAIITSVLLTFVGYLGILGNWLFTPLQRHPFAELLIVMFVCPCFLNVMQFWIQDSFLKDNSPFSPSLGRFTKKKTVNFDQELQMSLLSGTEMSECNLEV